MTSIHTRTFAAGVRRGAQSQAWRNAGGLRAFATRQSENASNWEKKMGQASGGLPEILEHWNRKNFYRFGAGGILATAGAAVAWGPSFTTFAMASAVGGYWVIGLRDINQVNHTIRRNFPVLGHLRYLLESIRPEIRQYLIEDDSDGRPFNREQRSMVYQRAKAMPDTIPFGTRRNVYEEGFEWLSHSCWPKEVREDKKRHLIGNSACKQPYNACRLNISGMSYGAISSNAILALNRGAKMGNFYHNTGEGGISKYHLEEGGDIVWNIGTGYFGCRDRKTGRFDSDMFKDRATMDTVKMIEIKLSQGAKPAHGGMLPGSKVTKIIAEARGVNEGETCLSPPSHSAFSDPRSLIRFVDHLRELSGGKPIGFKMCMGRPQEIAAIVGAMIELDVYPDFITVDGSEGGTGAAPPEFSNHVGWPLVDALTYTNNLLVGAGVRDRVTVIAAGGILSAFSMARTMALGADVMNSARAMLFALGCIQALKCNTNKCPTGITTQDPDLIAGLNVDHKSIRVATYHKKTLENFHELVGALGIEDPNLLRADHVMRRMAGGTYSKSYADIFPPLEPGSLLLKAAENHPSNIQTVWEHGQMILRGTPLKSIPLAFDTGITPVDEHRGRF